MSQFPINITSKVKHFFIYPKLKKIVSLICLQHDKIATKTNSYEMLETPIKDKSMLNTQAQKLCDNIDVSWMTPTCATDSNDRKHSRYLSGLITKSFLCFWIFFRFYGVYKAYQTRIQYTSFLLSRRFL